MGWGGGSSDELRLGRKGGAARVREFDPARALDARRETGTMDRGERVHTVGRIARSGGVEMDM